MRVEQGRCIRCRVRWQWFGRLALAQARCPLCSSPLLPSTKNVALPSACAFLETAPEKHLTVWHTERMRIQRVLAEAVHVVF